MRYGHAHCAARLTGSRQDGTETVCTEAFSVLVPHKCNVKTKRKIYNPYGARSLLIVDPSLTVVSRLQSRWTQTSVRSRLAVRLCRS